MRCGPADDAGVVTAYACKSFPGSVASNPSIHLKHISILVFIETYFMKRIFHR